MATSKQEMIEFIVEHADSTADPDAIRNYFYKLNDDLVRESYQKILQGERLKIVAADAETQKIKSEAAAQIAEKDQALKDLRWAKLCAHNFGGKSVANVISNRQVVEGWAQNEVLTPAFLQSILDSNPQFNLSWVKYESSQAQRQHNHEQDEATKQVLLNVCRRYNYAFSEANIAITLSEFPQGCDQYQLEQAIRNGQLSLHGASSSEIEDHTRALVQAHNKKWAAKSVIELKQQSAQERAEREAIFARVTPTPAALVGTVPLPDVITREKIINASRETIALWKNRYSLESLNARLQGLN